MIGVTVLDVGLAVSGVVSWTVIVTVTVMASLVGVVDVVSSPPP